MAVFGSSLRISFVAAVLAIGTVTPAGAAPPVAHVTVVHGLRGVIADIWLDGKKLLPSFQPERATDPLVIPAGQHHVDIRAEGAARSAKPLLSSDLDVPGGADLTVVAHLDAAGNPAISVFQDGAGKVPAGRSRVVVRHAAATAGIGVQLDEQSLVPDIAPGAEAIRDVAPGMHAVAITPAAATAGGTPLLAPQDVPLEEGSGLVLYLIGSAQTRTLSWLAQPVRARAAPPTLITTGDSGLRSPARRRTPPILVLGAILAASGVLLIVRRHRSVR